MGKKLSSKKFRENVKFLHFFGTFEGREEQEEPPSHLRNEDNFKGLFNTMERKRGGSRLRSAFKIKMCINTINFSELQRVANNLLLFFQRTLGAGAFFYNGGSGGTTMIGGGDGALEAHMGAAETSAGGTKNSFREGDYKKRPREGDYFQNLGYG